jgi:hypothetical protein
MPVRSLKTAWLLRLHRRQVRRSSYLPEVTVAPALDPSRNTGPRSVTVSGFPLLLFEPVLLAGANSWAGLRVTFGGMCDQLVRGRPSGRPVGER